MRAPAPALRRLARRSGGLMFAGALVFGLAAISLGLKAVINLLT